MVRFRGIRARSSWRGGVRPFARGFARGATSIILYFVRTVGSDGASTSLMDGKARLERRRRPLSTDLESSVESLDHPVDNAPVRTLQHKGLTIEGYSRAAVQTYWRVPEMKLGFDLGAQPWSFMSTPNWFVSHVHLDHVAALPVLVARRRMMKMEPPTIYLPAEAVEGVEMLLRAVQRLDRGRMPVNIDRAQARRRGRAVARAGRQGVCHQAHDSVAGLPRLGAPQEAQARIPGLDRRPDPRPAAFGRRGFGRAPAAQGRLHG